MNLSGKAVRYWLDAEKISADRLMVVTDDINLPFGTLAGAGQRKRWRAQRPQGHTSCTRHQSLIPV